MDAAERQLTIVQAIIYRALALIALTAVLAGCGQATGGGSSGGTTTTPPPGAIVGHVVSYRSHARKHLQPLPGVRVAAYRRAFPVVGPIIMNGPKAVAHTVSANDGSFSLTGLHPGRYFVVAQSSARWVQVSPSAGAKLTIAVCSDCPLPL
jgi:hypothetical protein